MEILKGMVRDVGYPDVECTYAKVDDNTIYYFIEAGELPNGNIIASTILKEAIGHAPYTSLGLINKNGDILIPFENKIIKETKDKLLLVEKNKPTSENVLEALKSKSDPFSASTLVETATTIKTQIKNAIGMSTEFIFDNQFSEAALYTMDGVNVANGYYSFISEFNGNYYFSSNVANSQIIKFNPDQLEETPEQGMDNTPIENNESEEQSMENTSIENSESEEQSMENTSIENNESEEQSMENNTEASEEVQEEDSAIKLNIDMPDQTQVENNEEINAYSTEEEDKEERANSSNEYEISNNEVNEISNEYEQTTEIPTENHMTTEDISNPVIADATNTIKKLLKENREQRQTIDKQFAEIEVIKSNYSILKEESTSREEEVISLRQELNRYRTQAIDLNRENTKLKSTLMRQSDVMKDLKKQNVGLREQVAGIHALGNAVAEANILIEPNDKKTNPGVKEFDYNDINNTMAYGEKNNLDNDIDQYQKTKAA